MSKGKESLEVILDELPFKIFTEYKFCSDRKFKADYYIPINNRGILIEYNGLAFNANESRHSNSLGIIRDMEKINLGTELGYVWLLYNWQSMNNPERVKEQILQSMKVYKNIKVEI